MKEFHKKKAAEIQEKLKDCVDKQSLKSLDKLTNIFDAAQEETAPETMDITNTTTIGIDAVDDDGIIAAKELKGENKAPGLAKKSKRARKHGIQAAVKKRKEEQATRRPKYFVQF
jgi:formaldehyde-activating enzyme involved in methanogenesis